MWVVLQEHQGTGCSGERVGSPRRKGLRIGKEFPSTLCVWSPRQKGLRNGKDFPSTLCVFKVAGCFRSICERALTVPDVPLNPFGGLLKAIQVDGTRTDIEVVDGHCLSPVFRTHLAQSAKTPLADAEGPLVGWFVSPACLVLGCRMFSRVGWMKYMNDFREASAFGPFAR